MRGLSLAPMCVGAPIRTSPRDQLAVLIDDPHQEVPAAPDADPGDRTIPACSIAARTSSGVQVEAIRTLQDAEAPVPRGSMVTIG